MEESESDRNYWEGVISVNVCFMFVWFVSLLCEIGGFGRWEIYMVESGILDAHT